MKKILFLLCILALNIAEEYYAQNFQTAYSNTRCGLNYTQASVLLGKRMGPDGLPYNGENQPAGLVVSGISSSAKVEKAFLWWDAAGSDTVMNAVLTNPNQQSNTFPGTIIGGGTNTMCYGPGYAFRADVTSIVSGNGTYLISGLPTDSTFDFANKSDVTGATLFIIYSDKSASFKGTLMINDGYMKAYLNTVFQTMSFTSPQDTSNGKAFMITGDMQNEQGTKIKMNNGPFITPSQNFWDFLEKNTVFIPGTDTSVFGIQTPIDCIHWLATGIYFQTPITPQTPVITRAGDNLTASAGSAYQWYFNNSIIQNSIFQTHLASQSGNYFVEVFESSGCSFFSDTIQVTVCADKIKPNIDYDAGKDSLWTDSTNFLLQWFKDGSAIPNATQAYHIVTSAGSYWVQAQDGAGCSVNSDIIPASPSGIYDFNAESSMIKIYPNPNNGNFQIENSGWRIQKVEIINILGEKIYCEISQKNHVVLNINAGKDIPEGIYFVKVFSGKNISAVKMIVTE